MDKLILAARRYLRLYKLYAKMDFAWTFRNLTSAVLMILADVIMNIASISGIFLLAWRFGGIGGMSEYEVLFMLGFNCLVTGFLILFDATNCLHISRVIGRGQMEHMMIQPLSFKAQVLTNGFVPVSGGSPVILGWIIIAIALKNLSLPITFLFIVKIIGYVIVSVLLLVTFSYLFSTLAFYAPKACEEISMYVIDYTEDLNVFPLSGMPQAVQLALITIVPTGLLVWFPAVTLVDRPPLQFSAAYPLFILMAVGALTTVLFKRGWNYYVKKGANRYSAGGFRR